MKKLLKPNLDLLSSWQKPQQQWADLPAARKVEETAPSKKVVAPGQLPFLISPVSVPF